MVLTSISSADPAITPFPQFAQSRQDFSAMLNALKTGDVDAAKDAFTALQQDVESIQSEILEAGRTPYFGSRPTEDVDAIKTALDSGDVKEARQAFHTLMQDLRQIRRHHLMMLHHARSVDSTGTEPTETAPPPDDTTGGTINVTA
jgi:DNA-binding FadR family transcriptional regulator